MRHLLVGFLLTQTADVCGQDTTFCSSSVLGQARPKAFELNYGRVVDFSVATRDVENDGLRFSEVRRNPPHRYQDARARGLLRHEHAAEQ
jgi:hypothetical protein